jgi:hypothetical protein
MSAVVDDRPRADVAVPRFPDITVVRAGIREADKAVALRYYGWPADLIAAGIMSADRLEPDRKHHRDARGELVTVTRYWRQKDDGQPHRYCQVMRVAQAAALGEFPGAREAIEACERYEVWLEAVRNPRPEPRPALLRLVIDNTRSEARS